MHSVTVHDSTHSVHNVAIVPLLCRKCKRVPVGARPLREEETVGATSSNRREIEGKLAGHARGEVDYLHCEGVL
jgi:hypothetical protein